MTTVRGSPFKINWNNKQAVIAYCSKLGSGCVVVKYHGRKNYNITHPHRIDRSKMDVVWKSPR